MGFALLTCALVTNAMKVWEMMTPYLVIGVVVFLLVVTYVWYTSEEKEKEYKNLENMYNILKENWDRGYYCNHKECKVLFYQEVPTTFKLDEEYIAFLSRSPEELKANASVDLETIRQFIQFLKTNED